VTTETIAVSGIRCERCVNRLAAALTGHEGLESANASLMGEVTLTWDEALTSRDALVEKMANAGFHPRPSGMESGVGAFPTS
jgi:copper chaperone CopZ